MWPTKTDKSEFKPTPQPKLHPSGLNRAQRRYKPGTKSVDYVCANGVVLPISPTKGFRKKSPWTMLAIKKIKED